MLPAFLVIVLTGAWSTPALAQALDPYNRTSPQSSVLAFLEASRAKNYNAALRYLDLRKLPPEERRKEGPGLAQDLAQVLDRDPQFDVAALSRDPKGQPEAGVAPGRERIATFHLEDGKVVELQLERQDLRSGVSVWLFSPESVAAIPTLAHMTTSSPLERHLPQPLVRRTLAGTALWRWCALLLAAAILAAVSKLLSRIVLAIFGRLLPRIAPKVGWSAADAFVAPLQLLVAVALFRAALEAIDPSPSVRLYLGRTLAFLSISGTTWLLMRLVDAGMRPLGAAMAAKHGKFTRSVLPHASRAVKLTIFVFAATALLGSWGYSTSTVLTTLGIGGVAIALAAQKTVENLFGGVAVISDRPVYIGEFCKFGDSVGTVEDIGLRSTRIRTIDRTLLTVPNAQFSSMTLENFSRRDKMLFHPTLNLRRDTTPDQVRTILASIQKMLEDHPKVETGDLPVRFAGVGTYSLDIEVFCYLLTLDGDEFLRMRQELLLRILDAVAAAGTALALPTQASIAYAPAPATPPERDTDRTSRPSSSSGGAAFSLQGRL
jgi:MscS family membrane protein